MLTWVEYHLPRNITKLLYFIRFEWKNVVYTSTNYIHKKALSFDLNVFKRERLAWEMIFKI